MEPEANGYECHDCGHIQATGSAPDLGRGCIACGEPGVSPVHLSDCNLGGGCDHPDHHYGTGRHVTTLELPDDEP